MNQWNLTRITGKDRGLEIKEINFPDNVSLQRDAECPYTINVTCEEQPHSSIMDDDNWWRKYALDMGVTSVCKTVSTGNATETTHVHFDTDRGEGQGRLKGRREG